MKNVIFLLFFLVVFQSFSNSKKIIQNQTDKIVIRYDPSVLRIVGNELPIGISTVSKSGKFTNTKGYLSGDVKWRHYRIEVEGGVFRFGKVHIKGDGSYKKGKNIVINVFHRKSNVLIHSQEIKYNYETGIELYPLKMFDKAPGSQILFGIRTLYDNQMVLESPLAFNFLKKESVSVYALTGGTYRNGIFKIFADPYKIKNHTICAVSHLSSNSSITDTFRVVLDYKKDYLIDFTPMAGKNGSDGFDGNDGGIGNHGQHGDDGQNGWHGNNGYDLNVFADVYFDTIINHELLYVEITEPYSARFFAYLINTQKGSVLIKSCGAQGGRGGNGGDGGNGGQGFDGNWYELTKQVNDSVVEIVRVREPGGPGGNGGDGGYGGNGGCGGNGGTVFISYTKYAQPFLPMILVENNGGLGGFGGSAGWSGLGGQGGKGNPNGSCGSSGLQGLGGNSGFNGQAGEIRYFLVEDEVN